MFKIRSQEKEIIDLRPLNEEETRDTFRLIRYVNRFLGGTNTILENLRRYSKKWDKKKTIRILDVASGAADIPQAIVQWARKIGQAVSVTAIENSAETISTAQEILQSHYPEIHWILAANPRLPFDSNSFDYVLASLFFHHLTDSEIIETLKIFDRIVKRGVIINDLLRCRLAYYGISLLSFFVKNKIFRNDAPLSVLRGFTKSEAEALIAKSGLDYLKFSTHFAFRLCIAGEKQGSSRLVPHKSCGARSNSKILL